MEIIDQLKGFDVLRILKETDAVLKGHFRLTSGFHSNYYLQCAKLLQYPEKTSELIDAALIEFGRKLNSSEIETVVSPAIGGVLFGYMLAYKLGVRMIFTERKGKKMELRRGFEINPKEKVLVAEDVITTGGSVIEVIDICRDFGADIMGVICIVDRSDNFFVDLPYFYLIKMHIEKFSPENCPLCKKNIELYYPGSRK
jgi:orotate phosphoribosyltransferase